MNVLMIFAPVHPSCDSEGMRCMPPLAPYALAAVLEERGHRVRVVDPHRFKTGTFFSGPAGANGVIEGILADGADVVGISANTGNWGVTRGVVALVRQHAPAVPIVLGGVHPTYFDEHALKTTPADYVVRGEGEATFLRLLDALDGRGDAAGIPGIPGLTYRGPDGAVVRTPPAPRLTVAELEALPDPQFDRVPAGVYNILPLETSRGCRFNCIFCSVVNRRHWRGCSAGVVFERAARAAPFVKDKLVADGTLYFVDDCFSADPARALDILQRIDDAGLDLRLLLECRVGDLLAPGFVDRLPKRPAAMMQIGVEAGYDEGLKLVRKGITTRQIEDCVALLASRGLVERGYLSFIIGFPWETEADCLKTVHLAGHLGMTYGIATSVNWLWLCPSDLWARRREFGIDLGEAAFDDPLWLNDLDVFQRAHPKVTRDVFRRVEQTIRTYQSSGTAMLHGGTPAEWGWW